MAFGGAALKIVQTFFYGLLFCCSAIILGIYSYFLAVQADHKVRFNRALGQMVASTDT